MSGLADAEITAVAYELARRLAGLWGVSFSPEQRKAAAEAKAQAIPVAIPTAYMAPGTVRGSGRRHLLPYITERTSGEE
jgi:hypothetical protein